MSDFKFPAETIELPSKGWFYTDSHPLSSGNIELHYMTARHEDILSSPNLIMKGVVIDKLLEALIATPGVKYEDLLVGDRNAVMLAARILGYGKLYQATVSCPQCEEESEKEINLEEIDNKEIDFSKFTKGKNEFSFTLPLCKKVITFRLLTQKDDNGIKKELESLRKALKSDVTKEVTTRMRYSLLSVDNENDPETVRKFIDDMPARDAMAFREYAKNVMPNVEMKFNFECSKCGFEDRLEVPIDHKFFWPNARI